MGGRLSDGLPKRRSGTLARRDGGGERESAGTQTHRDGSQNSVGSSGSSRGRSRCHGALEPHNESLSGGLVCAQSQCWPRSQWNRCYGSIRDEGSHIRGVERTRDESRKSILSGVAQRSGGCHVSIQCGVESMGGECTLRDVGHTHVHIHARHSGVTHMHIHDVAHKNDEAPHNGGSLGLRACQRDGPHMESGHIHALLSHPCGVYRNDGRMAGLRYGG